LNIDPYQRPTLIPTAKKISFLKVNTPIDAGVSNKKGLLLRETLTI
jgi:hypothetical protein